MTNGAWNENAWRLMPGLESMLTAFENQEGSASNTTRLLWTPIYSTTTCHQSWAIYFHRGGQAAASLAKRMQHALAANLVGSKGPAKGRATCCLV